MFKVDERVVNTTLAEILSSKYQLGAIPEVRSKKAALDVLIIHEGLRIVIEGRADIKNFDKLIEDTKKRLEQNYAIIGIALSYPSEVFKIEKLGDLKSKLMSLSYDVCILYWGRNGIESIRNKVNLDQIARIIKDDIVTLLIKNDVISELVNEVNKEIDSLSKKISHESLLHNPEIVQRILKDVLNIDIDNEKSKESQGKVSHTNTEE